MGYTGNRSLPVPAGSAPPHATARLCRDPVSPASSQDPTSQSGSCTVAAPSLSSVPKDAGIHLRARSCQHVALPASWNKASLVAEASRAPRENSSPRGPEIPLQRGLLCGTGPLSPQGLSAHGTLPPRFCSACWETRLRSCPWRRGPWSSELGKLLVGVLMFLSLSARP